MENSIKKLDAEIKDLEEKLANEISLKKKAEKINQDFQHEK